MEASGDSSESVNENAGDATGHSSLNVHLTGKKTENKRSPDPVLLTNKFKNEFGPLEDLTSLGSGYSGRVYEVPHVLDGDKYAVKRISLEVKKSSLVEIKRSSLATEDMAEGQCRVIVQLEENPRLKKLRREVELLKKLKHENIVRYFDSWLERDSSDSASSGTHGNKESSGNDGSSEHSSSVEFCKSSSPDPQCKNNVGQNGPGLNLERDTISGIHGNKESPGGDHSTESGSSIEVCLCIRMELCSMDLRKWLKERNKTYGLLGQLEMDCEAIRIFKEMVEGLRCIHELKIMHTDLKPANIFLTGPHLTVKIGDFGFSNYMWGDIVEEGRVSGEHTLRRGCNQLYPAPEILQRSGYVDYAYYDCKVDIYSLGIILFEMYNVVDSESKRENKIEQLRKDGKCPPGFKQKNKDAAALIEQMIHNNPKKRPTAAHILNDKLFKPVSEATSVNPGAGDASAAKGLALSGDAVDSESNPLPEMFGLKLK